MALFKFLNPFLQNASLTPAARALFQATLRILIVILHDFPDFLQEYYIGLCAAIPANCIQLRNVVLCAYAEGTPIPQDLKGFANLPALPEYNHVPNIRTDYTRFLDETQIRAPIDAFLQTGSPPVSTLIRELRNRIAISVITQDGSPGVEYNLTLLYSFSLYVGASAVLRSLHTTGEIQYNQSYREVELLNHVISSLDAEGESFVSSTKQRLTPLQVNITSSTRSSTSCDTPTRTQSGSASTSWISSGKLPRRAAFPSESLESCLSVSSQNDPTLGA